MAKSENNEVMYGARGKVGNLVVFKNFGGNRTIISKIPRKRDNPIYSEKQLTTKETFREAVIYAKGIIEDPDLLAFYQRFAKPGTSAYNMALSDFCRPSEIKVIDHTAYYGVIGDQIRIRAIDNFKVSTVKVSIYDSSETLIEEGLAVMSLNNVDWMYQATKANATLIGTTIKAEATDTPGNVTKLDSVVTSV